MSVLLIIPPRKNMFHNSDVCPGFDYLASILKKEGHDVKIINLESNSKKIINNLIKEENPKIIGIRCLTNERNYSMKLAEVIKKINKNIKIIIGGPHATIMYKQMLNNFPIDYVIIGEGEITFLELVDAIYNNKDTENIKGIAYKKESEVIKTLPRELISNLDSLPSPLYNLSKDSNETIWISAARGCAFDCGFCEAKNVWGVSYRTKSVKRIVDELEYYVNNYNKRYFGFIDDTFTFDKERTKNLCKEILDRGLKIEWSASTRVERIDAETSYWMKKAGCKRIDFGVESGSKIIRHNMFKYFKDEDVIKAFELTKKFKIKTIAYMILGYKGETLGTILQSVKLYNKIKPDQIITCPARLYPGSQLYTDAKNNGLISDDYWLSNKNAPIYTGSFSLFNILLITFLVTSYFELKKGLLSYIRYLLMYINKGLLKKDYFRENFYNLKG